MFILAKFKRWAITLIVLAVLIATNPNNNDFTYYKNAKGYAADVTGGRTAYLLVFSIYQMVYRPNANEPQEKVTYLGVFNNFIKLQGSLPIVK